MKSLTPQKWPNGPISKFPHHHGMWILNAIVRLFTTVINNTTLYSGSLWTTYRPACAHPQTGLLMLQRQTVLWWALGQESQLRVNVLPIVTFVTVLVCCTSAGGRGVVPLRRVSRDAVDGGLALQLVTRLAGEAQGLPSLVKSLFIALHAGGGRTGVPARLILLSCQEGRKQMWKENINNEQRDDGKLKWLLWITAAAAAAAKYNMHRYFHH